jgi:hypothetical protein
MAYIKKKSVKEGVGNQVGLKSKDEEREKDRQIYEEIRNLFSRLPAVWNILSLIAEKGTNASKILVQAISNVLREELRFFFKSIDVVGLMKRVILDTSVELKIEITFKDRSSDKDKSS